MFGDRAVILITGVQAAGKSTVAQLLAERLPRSVHVRGDLYRRMIVNGRAEMTSGASEEAHRQLRLRYELTASAADGYFRAGFNVIVQDVIVGESLALMPELVTSRPLFLVVLAPRAETIAFREAARGKRAYGTWTVEWFDHVLRTRTPRLGLWLDTSEQTAAETVEEILSRAWTEGAIPHQSAKTVLPGPAH